MRDEKTLCRFQAKLFPTDAFFLDARLRTVLRESHGVGVTVSNDETKHCLLFYVLLNSKFAYVQLIFFQSI